MKVQIILPHVDILTVHRLTSNGYHNSPNN